MLYLGLNYVKSLQLCLIVRPVNVLANEILCLSIMSMGSFILR